MQKIVMLTFSLVIKNLVEFMKSFRLISFFPSSIFPLVVAFLMLFNLGCKKSPTEVIDNTQPGRRDYVWTVDTLYLPYNPFTATTGTSPNDIWVCSDGDADKIFYHYDGKKWQTDLVPRSYSPLGIFSFGSEMVWSCGYRGKIWCFNGGIWKEEYGHAIAGVTEIFFQDILAVSANDIYAVGQYWDKQDYWGIILHYNGTSWTQINIPQIRTALIKISQSSNGKFYLLGVSNEQFTESTYQLYEFDRYTLKTIKTGTQANDQQAGILKLGNQVYFSIGFDLYSYEKGNFVNIGRLSEFPWFLNVGFGRNTKDVFLGMLDGIAHYNGENTEYLVKTVNNVWIRNGIIFEKDVFFVGRDVNGNNLIFHGKLKE